MMMVNLLRCPVWIVAAFAVCWLNVAVASVPLTVRCRCERADADRDAGSKPETLWVFVLDHSGSMGNHRDAYSIKRGAGSVLRWTALKDSFEETVRSIPIGASVQIYCVGGVSRGFFGSDGWDSARSHRVYQDPVKIQNSSDRDKLVSEVGSWGVPNGGTPLYDALFSACQDVENFRSRGKSCIVVFSDGKDESHADDCKTLQDIRDCFAKKTSESVGLFASDEFDACLTWIGNISASPEKVFGKKFEWAKTHEVPFVCQVNPASRSYGMRNPIETDGQAEISDLTYLFPMSDDRWQSMLKRGTAKPTLELSTADGAVLGSCVIDLGKVANAVFQLPDSVFAGDKATTLKLNLLLPEKDGPCRFPKTSPVRVMFDKVGKVSITNIRPAGDLYVTRGTKVDFSAEATSESTFTWDFGEGTSATNSSVSHVYTNINEAGYPYSLTVSHDKMSPDTRGGKIYVVDAGVAFSDLPKNATEGVECTLSCKAWKDVSSVMWYIDGVCYRGTEQKAGRDTISILRHTFDAAREYKVQARANVQRIGECSTEVATINVGAKPYARIVAPETANEKFDAGEDVEFVSRVSGVVSGKWRFADKGGKVVAEIDAAIAPDKPFSAAKQSFAEGGEYVASFVGKTATGADIKSDAMPFRINPRVIRIEIASPTADEEIKTDVAFKLCAKNVKGVEGAIQWFLADSNLENEKSLGESEVSADGTSEKSINFKSAEYGEGSFYLVARSADGKASSKPLPVTLRTQAHISIVRPANGETTVFDGRMTFSAKIDSEGGVLKSDSVRWIVQRVGGSPEPAGTKESCSYQFKRIPKVSSVSYSVRAEATLPSGRIVQSDDERTVVAYCPAIQASIVQPQVNSIGKEIDYTVSLDTHGGEVSDVVWDLDDGTIYTNKGISVTHKYINHGIYTIKASGHCAKCGDPFSVIAQASVVVKVQTPLASFAIEPDRETFSIRTHIKLKDTSSGDVDRCMWTTNGAVFATCGKSESVELALSNRPCEIQVGMRVVNENGVSSEAQPRTLRVRVGGWLIVPIVPFSLLLWIPLFRLLSNNGPAGWRVLAWKGLAPKLDKEGRAKEAETVRKKWEVDNSDAKPILKWWSKRGKEASIPPDKLGLDLTDMGGGAPPSGNLIIGSKAPKVGGLASLIQDQSASINLVGIPKVEFYRFSSSKEAEKKAIGKGNALKNLRIILDSRRRAYRYVVALWALTALLVATVTWIIFKFAI